MGKKKKKRAKTTRKQANKVADKKPPNKANNGHKPVKSSTAPKPQNKTSKKPKLSKEKESAIHRLLVVLGLVKDKKKANTKRKNMDLTKEHPRFPFWARLRMEKWRTTLVIDEEKSLNNKTNKVEDQFVHREATSPSGNEKRDNKYERIRPNPDKDKAKKGEDMLLKSPRKRAKHMFELHNKEMEMPKQLKDRYDKNNFKDKKT